MAESGSSGTGDIFSQRPWPSLVIQNQGPIAAIAGVLWDLIAVYPPGLCMESEPAASDPLQWACRSSARQFQNPLGQRRKLLRMAAVLGSDRDVLLPARAQSTSLIFREEGDFRAVSTSARAGNRWFRLRDLASKCGYPRALLRSKLSCSFLVRWPNLLPNTKFERGGESSCLQI